MFGRRQATPSPSGAGTGEPMRRCPEAKPNTTSGTALAGVDDSSLWSADVVTCPPGPGGGRSDDGVAGAAGPDGDLDRPSVDSLTRPNKADADTGPKSSDTSREMIDAARMRVQPILMERINVAVASTLARPDLECQIEDMVGEILTEEKLQLNFVEQRRLVTLLLDEMVGLGPLETLLGDETITDIMVNGAKQVFVERAGKLVLTDITFRDDAHVMNVATRIVSRIGRRVDESSPLADARLADGSRVNIIIPPLAIDGPSISIRKFSKKKISLEIMARQANISPAMMRVMQIAARCRLNILISGGTGSGKTTLLNALSRMIDEGERVITIEDAAELQLQQPHVLRLETRPPNLEGTGEINQRDLVRNALRMRPDRIILGEIRAGEALDMLQAMNTGHDGSMCTIHANRPREALIRLENMVAMTGVKLPHEAVRAQIAGAVNMVIQVSRMRDGVRRVTHITEVVGMEGEVITTQDLFTFEFKGEDASGRLYGEFRSSGLRPHFTARAEYYGLDRPLLAAISDAA
jgi:pilus assembly protein CpaF